MIAKVEGRLNIKREYDAISQQAVSGRTAKVNKETKPRSAIILDASSSNTSIKDAMQPNPPHRHKPVSHSASRSSSDITSQLTDPKGQSALTPPKSDGSPSSSSGRRGPKHRIPEAFSTLDLTIPVRWDGFIPIPIRLIHLAALKAQTMQDILSAVTLTSESDIKEAKQALHIVSSMNFDPKWPIQPSW
jgi:hypothetical protein